VSEQAKTVDGQTVCHGCGDRVEIVHKCGKCGLISYCGKVRTLFFPSMHSSILQRVLTVALQDCQEVGWNEKGHKQDCKELKDMKGLFQRDWSRFDGLWHFPL